MGDGGRARRGQRGPGGEAPAAGEVFVFKTIIFNASATVFARSDVLFELLLLLSK